MSGVSIKLMVLVLVSVSVACAVAEDSKPPADPEPKAASRTRSGPAGGSRGAAEEASADASSDRIAYGEPRRLAHLADRAITESSGLAASRRHAGVFWTHNDSGDGPFVYALSRQGEDLGTCRLNDVYATDWEDMASVTRGGTSYLLLADIGDNLEDRQQCQIHIIREPDVGTKEEPVRTTVEVLHRIAFSYEDGPRDCEAVAVAPADGTILLVDKLVGNVYTLPWPKAAKEAKETAEAKDELQTARLIGEVPIRGVTAMDLSPDGRRIVLLTYGDAFEYVRRPSESWAEAVKREPRRIRMPSRRKGEAIAYGPAGRDLYLTSEYVPTPLWEVPARDSTADSPAPDATSR